jgi:hypothetical protein
VARLSVVVDEQAQPFGSVHLVAHEMHESPQAHSGQMRQQPVDPSLQPMRSRARAAGNNQTARIARSRKRALTPKLYTRRS